MLRSAVPLTRLAAADLKYLESTVGADSEGRWQRMIANVLLGTAGRLHPPKAHAPSWAAAACC
ncbi:hypothetical protein ColTof4_12688 [Colletotrichum tofieldiae]|nr:hypothetical protein ColTof4_12688 [Colletotrichum tofieldiae]